MTAQSDLRTALTLAGQNLVECLCAEEDYLPYWSLDVTPDYAAQLKPQWPAHNLGRWWDAMLKLESAIGFAIPSAAEAGMLRNVRRFFDNPDGLCLSPSDFKWAEPVFELHSMREGLFALVGLIAHRNDAWAAATAHRMLATVGEAARPDGSWDLNRFEGFHRLPQRTSTFDPSKYFDPVGSHGRLIEPIIEYYQLTHDPLALDLATRFAEYHFENSTSPDGSFNPASRAHHTHSYFNTLRGMLRYGEMTRQARYIERVRVTYETTVRAWVKRSGFTAHDIGTDRRGETASPGDAAQLALWLGRHGHTAFLDDAERFLRARLLPSQITEAPLLNPAGPVSEDRFRDLAHRAVGAFGGMHYTPHAGKHNVTDVTGAGVHTLVDLYNGCVERSAIGIVVNFHFDHAGPDAEVTTAGAMGRTTTAVTTKTPGNVAIRVPRWTPRSSVLAMHNGANIDLRIVGDFAVIACRPGDVAALAFDLPEEIVVERTDGIDYTFAWRGDRVEAMSPAQDFFPFYPATADHAGRHSAAPGAAAIVAERLDDIA